jgi:hypothetical protein
MAPPRIGLIVTGKDAFADFALFIKTLEQWHPTAELFVYTDSDTPVNLVQTKLNLRYKTAMDRYKGLKRSQMETMKGIFYDSLFKDYTYEKAAVLEWMFETQATEPAWFLDADISHLAPLPVIPDGAELALSQHMIRPASEAKYGKYNAGYMWFKSAALLPKWKELGHSSRFYEQAALEDLANSIPKEALYEFPPQVNFGWWRMQQSTTSQRDIQAKFSIFRNDKSIGIRYDGKPLQSIHTHWYSTTEFECVSFRMWFDQFTTKFKTHKPLQNYRKLVGLN